MKAKIYVELGANVAIQVGSKDPMVAVAQSSKGLGCHFCVFNTTPVCQAIACAAEERFDNEEILFLPMYPDKSRGGEE